MWRIIKVQNQRVTGANPSTVMTGISLQPGECSRVVCQNWVLTSGIEFIVIPVKIVLYRSGYRCSLIRIPSQRRVKIWSDWHNRTGCRYPRTPDIAGETISQPECDESWPIERVRTNVISGNNLKPIEVVVSTQIGSVV